MPINAYFNGNGKKVMSNMRKTYPSEKKAKQVFYATANKKGQTAAKDADEHGYRERMHRALDRMIDGRREKRATDALRNMARDISPEDLKELAIARGQTEQAIGK